LLITGNRRGQRPISSWRVWVWNLERWSQKFGADQTGQPAERQDRANVLKPCLPNGQATGTAGSFHHSNGLAEGIHTVKAKNHFVKVDPPSGLAKLFQMVFELPMRECKNGRFAALFIGSRTAGGNQTSQFWRSGSFGTRLFLRR
jgi:hypothetical protein